MKDTLLITQTELCSLLWHFSALLNNRRKMSLVRALSVIVAAVFFIQLVNAGVSRRDTESATGGNEALDNILGQINTFAESLRTQVSQFTESTNMSQLLSDFQNQLNQVSQNLQQQFSPSAPAT